MKRSKLQAVSPTESLAYWLGVVCKGARVMHGLRLGDVGKGRIDNGTLSRFETEAKWNRNPEAIVACYAEAIGMEDSREIWERALDEWLRLGQAPTVPTLPAETVVMAAEHFARDIHEFVQRAAKDHAEPDTAPSEAQKKGRAAQ